MSSRQAIAAALILMLVVVGAYFYREHAAERQKRQREDAARAASEEAVRKEAHRLLNNSTADMIADAKRAEQRAAALREARKQEELRRVEAQADARERVLVAACKRLITTNLHDPASAQWEDDGFVTPYGSQERVSITLRARNAFNAMRVQRVHCMVNGDTIRIGDQ